jgi:hypothetical protein
LRLQALLPHRGHAYFRGLVVGSVAPCEEVAWLAVAKLVRRTAAAVRCAQHGGDAVAIGRGELCHRTELMGAAQTKAGVLAGLVPVAVSVLPFRRRHGALRVLALAYVQSRARRCRGHRIAPLVFHSCRRGGSATRQAPAGAARALSGR